MFFPRNVFGVLTLQVGVVSLASIFITLAVCILLVNVLSFTIETQMAWTIFFVFILFMALIWLIAFIGAYKESYDLISAAAILWTIYLALWVVLVVWSLIQENKSICIESRCPDVLWLINNHYLPDEPKSKENTRTNKQSFFFKKFDFFSKCKNSYKSHCRNIQDKLGTHDVKSFNRITNNHHKIPLTTTNQRRLIISITFFFIYAQILVYSWAVLFSYRKKIQLKRNVRSLNNCVKKQK